MLIDFSLTRVRYKWNYIQACLSGNTLIIRLFIHCLIILFLWIKFLNEWNAHARNRSLTSIQWKLVFEINWVNCKFTVILKHHCLSVNSIWFHECYSMHNVIFTRFQNIPACFMRLKLAYFPLFKKCYSREPL